MTIKTLFDPAKDIYRTIEKVITYNASQAERLQTEIREYIVTDNIDHQFEEVMSKMQTAMEQGGSNEVGVWVSGFYGSGKSSFTKYLGLALDNNVLVDGIPFRQHLQDRMRRPQTKALLNNLAYRFPAAVVMLDLASEMLAGATMADVSTVLYYKVLQWAKYSRNLKVAALERRLQKDGRYREFTDLVQEMVGVPWRDIQNDTLVIDSVLPEIAHIIYPELFKTPSAFNTQADGFILFETDRVQEMLEIVREVSGQEYIIFIIDEVGQYVGSRGNLILNLDGLAKNLKNIGDGKVWIMGTAQQTLTEDDPRAALNSAQLFKLTDRFPIQIDLESSDIKEICTGRLLGKSATGEGVLGGLFGQHGPALRHATKLQDARQYNAELDRQTFINLYPFLPAHFDILLHLLGALAKYTGGYGLRSAIKVIQDILIEETNGQPPVANRPVGWLATTVTLYDALEKDIRRAYPSVHRSVDKTLLRFTGSAIHQEIAKTVAILQILGNMPVTVQNVAGLMHPAVDAPPRQDQIAAAAQEMVRDAQAPFGEKEGNLVFFSEKLNDIDQERTQLPVRGIEARRIQNEALKDLFTPLPSTRLHNSLTVAAGLKAAAGSMIASLAGDREIVQMVVELVEATEYEATRQRTVDESRQRAAQQTIGLLGRRDGEIEERVAEIYRNEEIVRRYRNDPDQEIKEYCNGLTDSSDRLKEQLTHVLKRSLAQGSFVFRGQVTAVGSLDGEVTGAAKAFVAQAAEQVFDRYPEAPVRAETALAEKFLRVSNLRAISSALDPLGLVQVSGSSAAIQSQHRALTSIRDFLNRFGQVEGRRITDHFTGPPFGWSPDTLRYLLAAMLVAGELRLRVSGREVTVNGQVALEALRSNNSFKSVGVSLRDNPLLPKLLARAAKRLTDLVGESVLPLEAEISKTAARFFPSFQHRFGPLAEKLEILGLPGAQTVRNLSQELADIMLADASDAPLRLGNEESPLCDNLTWCMEIDKGLKNGLESTVRDLRYHLREIAALPDVGIPGQLRKDLEEEVEQVRQRLGQPNFHTYAADLRSSLTTIQNRSRDAAQGLVTAQGQTIAEAQADLARLPDWGMLEQPEQNDILGAVEELTLNATPDIDGIRTLLTQEYIIASRVSQLKQEVQDRAREKRMEQMRGVAPIGEGDGPLPVYRETLPLPPAITSVPQLDSLIRDLEQIKANVSVYSKINITLKIQE